MMASILLSEAKTILGVKRKRNRDCFDKNCVEIQEILNERNELHRATLKEDLRNFVLDMWQLVQICNENLGRSKTDGGFRWREKYKGMQTREISKNSMQE